MTDRVIADHIDPSTEISDGDGGITTADLLDEVSLYNLYDDRESPEQDAKRILDITYPTETLTTIVEHTAAKLDPTSGQSEGAHVIGGEFGSGKSHIELVVYHLLTAPEHGAEWLNEHEIDIDLPTEVRAAALQMLNLDRSYDQLHVAVGEYLGINDWTSADPPGVHEIRDALDGHPTAVFIDEFERWFGMSTRSEYKEDNLGFLQNLLEAAGREDTPLTVYVSLLFEEQRVQNVLPRTNPFRHDLSQNRDEKIRFLLHRLIGDVTSPNEVAELAREYTDVYRNNGQIQLSDYQDMEDAIADRYPFHPAALTILMDKFSQQQGYQDARGLLELLTEILADNYRETELILTGDVGVERYTGWFSFVDRELVRRYRSDHDRLAAAAGEGETTFQPYAEELLDIVLLYSLAADGEEGANKRDMLLGTMRKGENAHEIIQTFKNDVYGLAWHVFRINGEYAFDTNENPAARIQKKTEDIHKHEAIHRIERLVVEQLFGDRNDVYVLNPVNTEQSMSESKSLQLVVSLAAKRSYDEDIETLTDGWEFDNTLALVAPEPQSSIDSNTGIVELARKVVAGEQLLTEEDEALPDGFDEIHTENVEDLRRRVADKYGKVYTVEERGLLPTKLPVDGLTDDFYEAALDAIAPGSSQLREKVETEVEGVDGGIKYEFLRNDFYRRRDLPTLTDETELRDTLNNLCQDGIVQVGSYFDQSVGSIGTDSVVLHEQYVEEPGGDKPTITIDTRTTDDSGTTTGGVASGGSSSISGGSDTGSTTGKAGTTTDGKQILECPQCGRSLDETACECGFEFDATEITSGDVQIEGGSVDDLIDIFDDIETETVDGGTNSRPSTSRYPSFGEIEKNDKPSLIDGLERNLDTNVRVHKLHVEYTGTLDEAGVSSRGLGGLGLDGNVKTNEELTVTFPEPIDRTTLLNDVLLTLNVPEDATLELWLEVEDE
jgi:hypothetical protein